MTQAVSDSVMEHIVRDMISQFFDCRGGISHSDLGVDILKHGQIIIAVTEAYGIFPRNIKDFAYNLDSRRFGKTFGYEFYGGSYERPLMVNGVIPGRKFLTGFIRIAAGANLGAYFIDLHLGLKSLNGTPFFSPELW